MKFKRFKFPEWLKIDRECLVLDDPAIISTSGGKTSALMAALYAEYGSGERREYCFWNTGREHPKTYRYLQRLGDYLPMRYFEVRMPAEYGAGPSKMGFEEVSWDAMDRTGEPFRIFLDTIAQYRHVVKGEAPIGPNPVQRLCTAYMKAKLANHVAESFGWESFIQAVGLRADEPSRVAKISSRDTSKMRAIAPLSALGITKCHVEMFWDEQEFNLEIPPENGNCTACFLKDEADLAMVLSQPDPDGRDWEWWKKLDDEFAIRGRGEASYRTVQKEAGTRFAIRDSLVNIVPLPDRPDWMEPRRFKLVLQQERKILREGIKRVPCSCESAELMTDEYIAEKQECLSF